jgi:hypothetical protein
MTIIIVIAKNALFTGLKVPFPSGYSLQKVTFTWHKVKANLRLEVDDDHGIYWKVSALFGVRSMASRREKEGNSSQGTSSFMRHRKISAF